jgi:hypothetical protein
MEVSSPYVWMEVPPPCAWLSCFFTLVQNGMPTGMIPFGEYALSISFIVIVTPYFCHYTWLTLLETWWKNLARPLNTCVLLWMVCAGMGMGMMPPAGSSVGTTEPLCSMPSQQAFSFPSFGRNQTFK